MSDGEYYEIEGPFAAWIRVRLWRVLRAIGFRQVGPLGAGPFRYVGFPLLKKLKAQMCSHEFRLADLKPTGIEMPPAPPHDASCEVQSSYIKDLAKHPSHTQRVIWPCAKCGHVFTAHCGLDISPSLGPIVSGSVLSGSELRLGSVTKSETQGGRPA